MNLKELIESGSTTARHRTWPPGVLLVLPPVYSPDYTCTLYDLDGATCHYTLGRIDGPEYESADTHQKDHEQN